MDPIRTQNHKNKVEPIESSNGASRVVEIVKRGGKHKEQFTRSKLHSSIVACCLSSGVPIGQAENIANSVCDSVSVWLQPKSEVTSHDIRLATVKHLTNHHPDAAYLYEQHRITI